MEEEQEVLVDINLSQEEFCEEVAKKTSIPTDDVKKILNEILKYQASYMGL